MKLSFRINFALKNIQFDSGLISSNLMDFFLTAILLF